MRFRILSDLKKHYPIHYLNDADLASLTKLPVDLISQDNLPPVVENKENNTVPDHRITITFNPEGVDKVTGVGGSITIDMNTATS